MSPKLEQPPVGQYTPKYMRIDPHKREVKILKDNSAFYREVRERQYEQKTYLCPKQIIGFNFTNKEKDDPNWERLCEINKHQNMRQKHTMAFKDVDYKEDVNVNPDDLLLEESVGQDKVKEKMSFYSKELREPKYNLVTSDQRFKPCEKFNRYYLPNGKLVEIKDRES
jgi:hypothetical protein